MMLNEALKSRLPAGKAPAEAPEMPMESAPEQGADVMTLVAALQANPELMAQVQAMVEQSSMPSADEGPTSSQTGEDKNLDFDDEMTEDISEQDKVGMQGREKPRSLGERAQLAALDRKKSK